MSRTRKLAALPAAVAEAGRRAPLLRDSLIVRRVPPERQGASGPKRGLSPESRSHCPQAIWHQHVAVREKWHRRDAAGEPKNVLAGEIQASGGQV
jgi:hypothetical protein